MLRALKQFFDQNIVNDRSSEPEHALRLATAALLVEAVRIDGDRSAQERDVALRAVHEKFGLTAAQAEELLQLAEAEMAAANDYYQFTSLINQHFSQPQKERMVELMWQVAYADAALSAHELHLMRKVAGLLHVPDSAYIAAKMRARDAAGAAGAAG
ncbi:MAG: TerB family tellurite resistance protein [Burkholderiales bacterium]|jgi:uncharacterized tellurite resistance protein B-like protein|nr:TerB family tellurite resistance protein [Burkholderiales bacterium]